MRCDYDYIRGQGRLGYRRDQSRSAECVEPRGDNDTSRVETVAIVTLVTLDTSVGYTDIYIISHKNHIIAYPQIIYNYSRYCMFTYISDSVGHFNNYHYKHNFMERSTRHYIFYHEL